jgi:hypothetical protein
MMDNVREIDYAISKPVSGFRPSNDNRRRHLSFDRSLFPEDAVAQIYKPARSVTTSGNARANGWRLVFERRDAPFIEPLMGYTGGGDTLTQVELEFPTLQSAIRYAERQGLSYRAEEGGQAGPPGQATVGPTTEAVVPHLLRQHAEAARPCGTSGELW